MFLFSFSTCAGSDTNVMIGSLEAMRGSVRLQCHRSVTKENSAQRKQHHLIVNREALLGLSTEKLNGLSPEMKSSV